MQKVLNVTCSFDVQKYATESDVLKTKWLPVKECIKFSICQMAHKSIIDKHFLSYLGLKIREQTSFEKQPRKYSLIESIGRTFANDAKIIYVLPKDL